MYIVDDIRVGLIFREIVGVKKCLQKADSTKKYRYLQDCSALIRKSKQKQFSDHVALIIVNPGKLSEIN